MGSVQSNPKPDDDEDEEDEEEGEDERLMGRESRPNSIEASEKKLLEQEPEVLPCHPSASPLSPQLSSLGTPYLGPSIKVWDPCHVLYPTRPSEGQSLPTFRRYDSFDDPAPASGFSEDSRMEVYLISHGECGVSVRPDLVGGRWPTAGLTADGKRQARALAVFLNSQGVRFNVVYCSPLERARQTAASVCQELHFVEEQIQSSDALTEMSQGQWEGCPRSEIYTPDMVNLIERLQPDFSPPFGESLRHVEFRMIEFLNSMVVKTFQKARSDSSQNLHMQGHHHHERDGNSSLQWELFHRNRQSLRKKSSGKSRLQFVTMSDMEADDDSPREVSIRQVHDVDAKSPFCVGVFTHALPIRCLLTGLLGCSPLMAQKICIDDSSMTVLEHSLRTGWQIRRWNDTSHLRLL
ncbi:2-3-bisphosphoglycerate-dependent phosphoglycerate mutase [Nymphaea thermarum]|nr:2-3-bisphosphoglycerate-dependent phosphoglycerate mutase [Nymphaea thermarum]